MRTWPRTDGRTASRTFNRNGGGLPPVVTDSDFGDTVLLLPGNGTNGAQNNTFLDGSTNNFTITRNGNTTQGTFSPFSQTGWSNYFDGVGDYLRASNNTAFDFGTGDITFEAWVFVVAYPAVYASIVGQDQNNNQAGTSVGLGMNSSGQAQWYASASSGSYTVAITGGVVPRNTWTHLAGVRNGNTWTLYINGTASGTATSSVTITQGSSPYGGLTVSGLPGYNDYYFTGYISNARAVKGTAVYTGNFTPPTSPLTAISGTSLLTCQSNRFVDNSTNAFAITRNGDVSVQAFSPFNPTAAWSAATNGGSGYFDGSGDYLSVANNAALDMASTFSLEFWIYRTNGNDQMYVARGGGAANWNATNGYQYACFISSGTFYFQFNSGGSAVALVATATLPALNAWTHVAVARDGTTMRIWINGTSVGTSASSPTVPSTTNLTYIGQDIAGGAYAYAGYMTDYRFLKNSAAYDASQTTITVPTAPVTAITNTSLLLNFTNAGIYDATAKNDLETVGNAQISTAQSKFGGSSMYFDGTGDYLKSNAATSNLYAFGTGDFTIEFWVWYSSLPASNYCFIDFSQSVTGAYPAIYITSAGTLIYFANGGNQIQGTLSGTSTWHHIAVSRSGTSTKLFANGTQIGSTYTDSTNYSCFAGRPYVGAFGDATFPLNGYINDLRITKGVARYTSAFTPPTAAFPLR